MSEALQKMKGKIPEIASSHVSSRVLQVICLLHLSVFPKPKPLIFAVACIYVYFFSQTCVKYCSKAERDAKKKKVEGDAKKRKAEKDAVFEELKPHFLTLARSAYGVHLVKKMLDNGMFKLGNDRIEVYSCCSY